ncbi:MAG: hypothetical protein ABIN91_12030 [Mucilaginibacter sp.]|uniref:hypothetical protein n=1 Tax=Mucilaginibacter sp. TaxID=1882438 RepID=UPI0032678519
MKTRLSLLFIPILFLVTACTKSTVNPNQTILTTISSSKWSTVDGGKTYAAFISTPEIDSYTNAYDAVLVYASFDAGKNYEQVPEVYNGIAYSFTHKIGQVEIDAQSSTGANTIPSPGTVDIKIVLVRSAL